METVKDSKEFQCIMEARRLAMRTRPGYHGGWRGPYGSKNAVIACHPDGTPLNAADKRTVCETEKLALGLKRAYMECSTPGKYDPVRCSSTIRAEAELHGLKRGDTFRVISLVLDMEEWEEENAFLDRFFIVQTQGVKIKPRPDDTVGYGPGSGSVCAYPGGCD